MKKISLVVALSLMFGMAYSQTDGYIIKNDGTRIEFYPTPFALSGVMIQAEDVLYYDKKGKGHGLKHTEVKELYAYSEYWGPEYYILLPITKRYNRLVKVIATNDEYILSVYAFQSSEYLYVHTKQTKEEVVGNIKYINMETDYSYILKTIKKYFPNCAVLFEKMEQNSKSQSKEKKAKRKGPFYGICNMSCIQ